MTSADHSDKLLSSLSEMQIFLTQDSLLRLIKYNVKLKDARLVIRCKRHEYYWTTYYDAISSFHNGFIYNAKALLTSLARSGEWRKIVNVH